MKRILLNIVFATLFAVTAIAQPYTACFDANKTKGCVPMTINMTDCSGSNAVFYDYGDGSGFVSSSSHTYTSPGIYTVTQTVDDGVIGVSTLTKTNYIIVQAPRAPSFELEVCQGGDVTLTITDTIDNQYVVSFAGVPHGLFAPYTPIPYTYPDYTLKNINITPFTCGFAVDTSVYPINTVVKPDITTLTVNNQDAVNGQINVQFNALIEQRYALQQSVNGGAYVSIDTLDNISGAQNYVINNLNTASNQYCYQLIAYDDCGNTQISEEICSIISSVTAVNNQNDISWNAHLTGNVANYHVYRDTTNLLVSTAGLAHSDLSVTCAVNYCYNIETELTLNDLSGNPLRSISDYQCVTAISTNVPAAVQNLHSTVNGSSVILTWDNPATAITSYSIGKSVNGSAYTPYTTYTSPLVNNYTDNGVSIPGNEYCYTLNYTDLCGNTSASGNTTCPVTLEVTVDNTGLTNYLSWSPYTGAWPGGVLGYIVQRLDENNNVISTVNAGLSLNYTDVITGTDIKVLKYRIQVIPNGPAAEVPYSNIEEIKYEGEVHMPNAFTPNGDGMNDIYMAKGKFIKDFKLTIFNRWGEVVYSTDVMDSGWDGSYQGVQALPDAYAYLVEATDFWDKTITKRGSVTLLK